MVKTESQPANASHAPAVELEHVTRSFAGRTVLNDLSLRVDPGTAFCLLGRSGVGKSVTLKIMVGLIPPDRGKVCIEHRDRAPRFRHPHQRAQAHRLPVSE